MYFVRMIVGISNKERTLQPPWMILGVRDTEKNLVFIVVWLMHDNLDGYGIPLEIGRMWVRNPPRAENFCNTLTKLNK